MNRGFVIVAAVFGLLGVALAAVAEHVWRPALSAEAFRAVEWALSMGRWHAVALLALGFAGMRSRWFAAAGWLWIGGVVLFCGSLLVGTLTVPALKQAAPMGGWLLMGGWVMLGVGAWRLTDRHPREGGGLE